MKLFLLLQDFHVKLCQAFVSFLLRCYDALKLWVATDAKVPDQFIDFVDLVIFGSAVSHSWGFIPTECICQIQELRNLGFKVSCTILSDCHGGVVEVSCLQARPDGVERRLQDLQHRERVQDVFSVILGEFILGITVIEEAIPALDLKLSFIGVSCIHVSEVSL